MSPTSRQFRTLPNYAALLASAGGAVRLDIVPASIASASSITQAGERIGGSGGSGWIERGESQAFVPCCQNHGCAQTIFRNDDDSSPIPIKYRCPSPQCS